MTEELKTLAESFLTEFVLTSASGMKIVYSRFSKYGLVYGICNYDPIEGISEPLDLTQGEYQGLLRFKQTTLAESTEDLLAGLVDRFDHFMNGLEIDHDCEH